MGRNLVHVSGSVRSQELLATAADHAAGADAELVLYAVVEGESTESVRQAVERIASSELAGRDVEYGVTIERTSGSPIRQVVRAADERDCDHLFLLGRPQSGGLRSILSKDPIAEALDGFDGIVTVGRETAPENRDGTPIGMLERPEDFAGFVDRQDIF